MNSRYKKRGFFDRLFDDFPFVELVVLGVIFLVSLSLLFLPKEVLNKLSTLWFISVF